MLMAFHLTLVRQVVKPLANQGEHDVGTGRGVEDGRRCRGGCIVCARSEKGASRRTAYSGYQEYPRVASSDGAESGGRGLHGADAESVLSDQQDAGDRAGD